MEMIRSVAVFLIFWLHPHLSYGQAEMSLKPCSGERYSCVVIPCSTQTCQAFPQAQCRNNYCNGCSVEFWVGDVEVTSQCDAPSVQATGVSGQIAVGSACEGSSVRCLVNPCATARCPNNPTAECRSDGCSCDAQFWSGGVEVTAQCEVSNSNSASVRVKKISHVTSTKPCQSGNTVRCQMSPCVRAECPNYPQAECRNNYCDGCNAEFWNGEMEVTSACTGVRILTSGSSLTAGSSASVGVTATSTDRDCASSCFYPPCLFSFCPAYPEAECRNNFCQGCSPQYFVGSTDVTSACRDRIPSFNSFRRLFSGVGTGRGNGFWRSRSQTSRVPNFFSLFNGKF